MPPIALAPGGTVCTVARNLETGRGSLREPWAARVVRAVREGTATARPQATLRVRDDRGGERIGFIFGAGLVVRFFEAYDATANPGRRAAAGLVARIFAGSLLGSFAMGSLGRLANAVLDPTPCSLRVDGETQAAHRWSLVVASVVRDVGLHMLVPYRAGEELERFHLVASGLPPRELAAQLPRVLLGRPLTGEPRVDTLARSLRLAFEDGASGAPDRKLANDLSGSGYVLDGDRFAARAVTVEPGPVISLLV